MKRMACIGIFLGLISMAQAQEPPSPTAADMPREDLEPPPGGLPQGRASGAPGGLIGAELVAGGVPVGSVKDVVVGAEGRIDQVIVSIGMADRLVALDWGQVQWNRQAGQLLTETPPDQLAALPETPADETLKFERMEAVPEARGPALPEPPR